MTPNGWWRNIKCIARAGLPSPMANLFSFGINVKYLPATRCNLQLQGDNLNVIKTKSIIATFLARINLMKQNIERREFSVSQFVHGKTE